MECGHGALGASCIWQSLAENAMRRYKAIIGPRLRARCLAGQRIQAAICVPVLNRMLEAERPKSIRNMENIS